jgi:hypothetical protein
VLSKSVFVRANIAQGLRLAMLEAIVVQEQKGIVHGINNFSGSEFGVMSTKRWRRIVR